MCRKSWFDRGVRVRFKREVGELGRWRDPGGRSGGEITLGLLLLVVAFGETGLCHFIGGGSNK